MKRYIKYQTPVTVLVQLLSDTIMEAGLSTLVASDTESTIVDIEKAPALRKM